MIIDDFLSQEQWDFVYKHFQGDNWKFPNLSGIEGNQGWRIFTPEAEKDCAFTLFDVLTYKLEKPWTLKRVGINGACYMNESHKHQDGPKGDLSIVWFGSKGWKRKWGGDLIIWKDDKPIRIPYVPNRAVLFDSDLFHMPMSPTIEAKNQLRISVGLHLTPSENGAWNCNYIPREGYLKTDA